MHSGQISERTSQDDYLPCIHCLGFIKRKDLWRQHTGKVMQMKLVPCSSNFRKMFLGVLSEKNHNLSRKFQMVKSEVANFQGNQIKI